MNKKYTYIYMHNTVNILKSRHSQVDEAFDKTKY